jgi:signal peptidase I
MIVVNFVGTQLPTWSKWPLFVLVAISCLFLASLIVRRLHDIGRSGAWAIVIAVPIVSLVMFVWLGFAKSDTGQANSWLTSRGQRIGQGLVFLLIPLAVSRAFWEPYTIPASSMSPALQVGDYMVATKIDTNILPARGDIVTFAHPIAGVPYVKRVVGLPADSVQMRDGIPVINGVPATQTPLPDLNGNTAALETLPNGKSYPVLELRESSLDNTDAFLVPDGHLFVLGDNRDNSIDSRVPQKVGGIGFVPVDNLIAKPRFVAISTSPTSYAAMWDRFFVGIR